MILLLCFQAACHLQKYSQEARKAQEDFQAGLQALGISRLCRMSTQEIYATLNCH